LAFSEAAKVRPFVCPFCFLVFFRRRRRRQNEAISPTLDFWLVKHVDMQIQGRFVKEAGGESTALAAIAVGGPIVGGQKLVVEAKSGIVSFLGKVMTASQDVTIETTAGPASMKTYGDASTAESAAPAGVDISLPLGVSLQVRRYIRRLDAKITMVEKIEGSIDGQCGNINGDPTDDTLELIGARMSMAVSTADSLF